MLITHSEDLNLDEYNRDIDDAVQEIKQGSVATHEPALKQLNKLSLLPIG